MFPSVLKRRVTWLMLCMMALAFGPTVSARGAETPPSGEMFFESRVRPLLVDNCLGCHGEKKQKGGLRLDSHAAIMKGGKNGPVLVGGNPQASRLITAIAYTDPDLQMPPDDHLSANSVRVLTEWVKSGAPWPAKDASIAAAKSKHRVIVPEDRNFWSFQPMKSPEIPTVAEGSWCRNEIDRFVLAKLEAEGITPSPQAERTALIRRATFDLTGLPPTPNAVKAFIEDPAPDAYEKVIDRLLASPEYGVAWGRHWLDLVRYAESDGFKQDAYRANAWPYRDYVIRAFNDDKPYDRFVIEQLAGDELDSDNPDVMVATGFLRAGLYEYNQRDVPKQWHEMLTDVTDVTADAFLGLSMGCARCHDHKFDPILQTDYYRLQAFFAPMLPRNDLPLVTAEQKQAHAKMQAEWEQKTADVRAEMAPLEKKAADAGRGAFKKFEMPIRTMLEKPAEVRTPLEEQLVELAMRQIHDPTETPAPQIAAGDKAKYDAMKVKLSAFDAIKPKPLFRGLLMTDVGPIAPPTYMPGEVPPVGSPASPTVRALEPGWPVVFDGLAIPRPPIVATANSTGRRLALARWIVQPENPLTARVMVNRIWQYHFGRGLVETSSDFGHLGSKPSDPELLDFLARRFVDGGWKMKAMHRLIMTSAAYRQTALRAAPELAKQKDPDNRWLWRMNSRRLDAEAVRDAMLAVSGALNLEAGGPSADLSSPRRSIFLKLYRNQHDSLLDAFDLPDAFNSVAMRNQTTTATQALLLINGDQSVKRAVEFANRVRKETGTAGPAALVETVYRLAYCRPPESDERELAVRFFTDAGDDQKTALVDFCHVILNSSEFLYVD